MVISYIIWASLGSGVKALICNNDYRVHVHYNVVYIKRGKKCVACIENKTSCSCVVRCNARLIIMRHTTFDYCNYILL